MSDLYKVGSVVRNVNKHTWYKKINNIPITKILTKNYINFKLLQKNYKK